MRIRLHSVFVDDQEQGVRFYTEVLGFAKKYDIPMGEFRWLTVVSPEEPDGTELVLEPSDNPATQAFRKSIYAQKIPASAFAVDDLRAEHARLTSGGVRFTMEPAQAGPVTMAVFDDTCGNLIQIYQVSGVQ